MAGSADDYSKRTRFTSAARALKVVVRCRHSHLEAALLELHLERAQRVAAVGDRVFLIGRHFGGRQLAIERVGVKKKIQLALYLPNFISVIVLCGLVRIFLSVTGPVNLLLGSQINFMTMPEAWRSIYIASGIWQGAGWGSIIYTAALSNASTELKEAAVIDGANIFQQIKAVEWPAIKSTVIIQFIMQAGNIMSIGFEKAYALQTDLNLASSEIISTYVYKRGLIDGDHSFSTAVGLFNTVINVILLVAVNKIVAKMNDGQGL